MKKLFITAAIATMFSVTAFADGGKYTSVKTGEDKIAYAVLNQFNADFKGAKDAAWTVTSNCEKVAFTLEGAKMTAFYDLVSGEYLGATQVVDFKTISFTAQETIAAKYKGYAVKEVIKYVNDKATADISPEAYFVDLKKTDAEIIVKVVADETAFFKKVK